MATNFNIFDYDNACILYMLQHSGSGVHAQRNRQTGVCNEWCGDHLQWRIQQHYLPFMELWAGWQFSGDVCSQRKQTVFRLRWTIQTDTFIEHFMWFPIVWTGGSGCLSFGSGCWESTNTVPRKCHWNCSARISSGMVQTDKEKKKQELLSAWRSLTIEFSCTFGWL